MQPNKKRKSQNLLVLMTMAWLVFSTSIAALPIQTDLTGVVDSQTNTQSRVESPTGAVTTGAVTANVQAGSTVQAQLPIVSNGQTDAQVRTEIEIRESTRRFEDSRTETSARVSDYAEIRERWRVAIGSLRLELQAELFAKAKAALNAQVDTVIAFLEAKQEQIGAKDSELQAQLDYWQDFKVRLNRSDLTWEELKDLSAEAREKWKDYRVRLNARVLIRLFERMELIIRQAESFSTRLEAHIGELKAAGKDTVLLERGLEVLKSDIRLYTQAQAEFRERIATNPNPSDEVIRAGQRLAITMHARLKEDFRLIKALLYATSELNATAAVSTQTSAQINSVVVNSPNALQTAIDAVVSARATNSMEVGST